MFRLFPIIIFMLTLHASVANSSEIFKCEEPQGVAMWSMEKHKPEPDGFKNVNPVIVIEKETMTIVWGDSKAAGGAEKSWKAVIIHRDKNMVTGVSIDADDGASSAAMLYSVDLKRGFLYMSTHKNSVLFNGSSAASFVGKCTKM